MSSLCFLLSGAHLASLVPVESFTLCFCEHTGTFEAGCIFSTDGACPGGASSCPSFDSPQEQENDKDKQGCADEESAAGVLVGGGGGNDPSSGNADGSFEDHAQEDGTMGYGEEDLPQKDSVPFLRDPRLSSTSSLEGFRISSAGLLGFALDSPEESIHYKSCSEKLYFVEVAVLVYAKVSE